MGCWGTGVVKALLRDDSLSDINKLLDVLTLTFVDLMVDGYAMSIVSLIAQKAVETSPLFTQTGEVALVQGPTTRPLGVTTSVIR